MFIDLCVLAYHTILDPIPDINIYAVPANTGSNQVGCRTSARMIEVVVEVETSSQKADGTIGRESPVFVLQTELPMPLGTRNSWKWLSWHFIELYAGRQLVYLLK